jgi:phosphomannomutase/phosphoglucomutase
LKEHIFREYDIRGTFPDELNRDSVQRIGSAVGSYLLEKGAKEISLGRDCRLSSEPLAEALLDGLLGSGVHVVQVGMVPTPLLYFSIHALSLDGGVQITGSHNPPEFNGFKICLGTSTIYGQEIQEIRKIAVSGDWRKGTGRQREADIVGPYLAFLRENIQVGPIKRRVVVDAGNGVGGLVAPQAYRAMGHEVIPLFCDPDGRFPNHHPDPTLPENLHTLIEKVKESGADLGIGFDGDADRIGVVDHQGNIIWGDQLMVVFSKDLLKRHPGGTIIAEVKCSQVLFDEIKRCGGRPVMWKAGHSLIKSKMKEEKALLAGEMSGHIFFAERYLGFDDAVYAGARLLEILSQTKAPLSDFLSDLPKMVNTPEIRIDCPDERKFGVVEELAEAFKRDYPVIDVDGARVLFEGGWGLVRASNTQPVLVLRFEAKDEARLEEIRRAFMERLEQRLQSDA